MAYLGLAAHSQCLDPQHRVVARSLPHLAHKRVAVLATKLQFATIALADSSQLHLRQRLV